MKIEEFPNWDKLMRLKDIQLIERCGGFRFFSKIHCTLMIITKYGPKI